MQIVGYETWPDPMLLLARDGALSTERLEPGRSLSYVLGERRCAGVVVDGEHRACERPIAPHCEAHASTWICARCRGTCLKDEMDCRVEHAVYLAAFAPSTFKVGVTKLHRLETRLREQGADRGAHVHTVPDGRIARAIEADVSSQVPDRVRVPTKIEGMHRSVDEEAWERLLERFDVLDRYSFAYGFDLSDRPMPETIATGTVVGTKGRVLLLERGGSTYAVDLRDLVGHEIGVGSMDRDIQSSLGAFP